MKLKHYILPILIVISTVACKPKCHDVSNPDCEDYDPCYGKTRINSNFRVRPGDNEFKPPETWCDLIPCDTFNASSVRFDIPLNNPDNSIYTWQIGTEPTPRTGKKFEVDFSDYLNAGKWETFIPVTLTIRTPLNSCLTHPEDTLIKVTRQLFFTQKNLKIFKNNETTALYKGYFNNNPDKEVTLTFISQNTGKFRGISAPLGLVVGVPNNDTFVFPPKCQQTYCYNYLHVIGKVLDPTNCFPNSNNYLSYFEEIKQNGIDKIKNIWVFDKPTGSERYEFIGNRIN